MVEWKEICFLYLLRIISSCLPRKRLIVTYCYGQKQSESGLRSLDLIHVCSSNSILLGVSQAATTLFCCPGLSIDQSGRAPFNNMLSQKFSQSLNRTTFQSPPIGENSTFFNSLQDQITILSLFLGKDWLLKQRIQSFFRAVNDGLSTFILQ